MERRVLLAVFLCFVVLYAYQAMFVKAPPPKPRLTQQASQAPAPAAAPGTAAVTSAPPLPATPVAAKVSEASERTITVETNVVRAVFTNRGGGLASWRLKQYLDDRKHPLELVATELMGNAPRPFSLRTDDVGVDSRLDAALFQVSESSGTVNATKTRVRLAFEYQDDSGLRATKTFVIEPNSYVIGFEATVAVGDRALNPYMVWGPGLGDAAAAGESNRYLQKAEGIWDDQSGIRRLAVNQVTAEGCTGLAVSGGCLWENTFRFAGVDDHYFASVVLAKGKTRIEYHPVIVPGAKAGENRELVSYAAKVSLATPGMRVFAGPKDFDVLASVDGQMVRIINFGMFSWLAVPLLRALKSINGYVGNYGWSIIILTILINAVMFPLRHKSMVSMRKMQKLQPETKAIQDRYAKLKTTDPARQKMNAEMMALYREKGVNPASGCVPMLLTMPVLFAFYSMLSQAIEVRGAPFGLWIQDLSRYDPYYVTPVLMGATMLWQQKMTPSSVDPAQQKMMLIMPIFFTAFFLWSPSGLALYFLLSNMLAIGQQYLTNHLTSADAGRVQGTRGGKGGKGSTQ
jgi:YidC/Oxa1 family membrane protein insertase